MPEILELNTKVDEEHALEIERQIRVIKERAWKIWSSISFKEILGVIFIVKLIAQWITPHPPYQREISYILTNNNGDESIPRLLEKNQGRVWSLC